MPDRMGLELSTKLIKEIKYGTAVIAMPIVSANVNTIVPSEELLSNQLTGLFIEVIDGNGKGQLRKIISNTTLSITVAPDFITVPEPFSIITIHNIQTTNSDLSVLDKTVELGQLEYVSNGVAYAFNNLTVDGTLVIKGVVEVYGILDVTGTLKLYGTLHLN